MNRDRGFAGLLLIAAAIYGAIWYYRRRGTFNATQGFTVDTPLAGKVQVGSRGAQIEQEAEESIGKSTAGLPGYPRRACASWISEILSRLGIIKGCFPSVSGLAAEVKSKGAQLIAPKGTSVSDYSNLQPGDIVFFMDQFGLRHAAEYAGEGNVIGNSSSLGKVEKTPMEAFGYPSYEAYRF